MSGYFSSAARALATSLGNLFRRPVTVEFPKVIRPRAERYRSSFALLHEEDGDEACIGCLQCERICPSQVIAIKAGGKRESPISGKKRGYADDFVLDLNACIYCELCVQVCPTDAIVMTREPRGSGVRPRGPRAHHGEALRQREVEAPGLGRCDAAERHAGGAEAAGRGKACGRCGARVELEHPVGGVRGQSERGSECRGAAGRGSGCGSVACHESGRGYECGSDARRESGRDRIDECGSAGRGGDSRSEARDRSGRNRRNGRGAAGGRGGGCRRVARRESGRDRIDEWGSAGRGGDSRSVARDRSGWNRGNGCGAAGVRSGECGNVARGPASGNTGQSAPRNTAGGRDGERAGHRPHLPQPTRRARGLRRPRRGGRLVTDELGSALLALVLVGVPALRVVTSRDLVRAILWLAATLLGTAVLYAFLRAPFLAGVQVLTYVGGVVTLMVFGVMVTRKHEGATFTIGSIGRLRGALAALGFFVVVATAVLRTDLSSLTVVEPPSTQDLAHLLLDRYLLAFEVASVLLLAAIVSAVVLARRRDPAPDPTNTPEAAALREGSTR